MDSKPIKSNYIHKSDYIMDSITYHFKKNSLIYVISVIVIIGLIAGILIINSVNSKKEAKSVLLMEQIEQDVKNFIKQKDQYSNYDKKMKEHVSNLDELINKYKGTTNAYRATYYKAYIYYNDNQFDKAIELFDKVGENEDFYLAPISRILSATILTNQGKYDIALERLDSIYKDYKKESYAAQALYYKGMISQEKGNEKEALKLYLTILKDYSVVSTLANDQTFKNKISILEAKYPDVKLED